MRTILALIGLFVSAVVIAAVISGQWGLLGLTIPALAVAPLTWLSR